MKDGLIVYLVGGAVALPEDLGAAARALGRPGQQVEMVAPDEGFFTVEDAWHFLYTQGCGRISLVVAEAGAPGTLKPLSPPVRLCG